MIEPYYQEDGITLYCGDCRDILPQFKDKEFDLVLTDPPYGQELGYGRGQLGERYIENDDNLDWLPPVSLELFRILNNNKTCLMFSQWRKYSEFEKQSKNVGFKIRSVAIWDKGNAGLSGGGFAEEYEQIIVMRKGDARETRYSGNVFNYSGMNGRPQHPHEKPIQLIKDLMDLCSLQNDSTLDPFCGSGTTLVAAKQLGRKAVGIEISEKYCEIAVKRIAQQQFDFQEMPEQKEEIKQDSLNFE